jgi:hypothetical protein
MAPARRECQRDREQRRRGVRSETLLGGTYAGVANRTWFAPLHGVFWSNTPSASSNQANLILRA